MVWMWKNAYTPLVIGVKLVRCLRWVDSGRIVPTRFLQTHRRVLFPRLMSIGLSSNEAGQLASAYH